MLRLLRKSLEILCVFSIFVAFFDEANAKVAEETVVKIGTVAPANTPWADTLDDIKKRAEKDSSGRLKIKTYMGGQLGGELEILRALRTGRIQAGGFSSASLASIIPEIETIEIPFIFDSSEQADYVLDEVLFNPFQELFEKKGLVLVSWAENGWRDIGSKSKAIEGPSDLDGMKVRSQESKIHLEFWKSLGANPIPIAVPDVLPALQTGMVEGFDNTALFTLSAEWHTAIKNFTLSHHIYQPGAILYNKKFWDQLSPENRAILLGKGNEDAPKWRKAVRNLSDQLVAVLKESGVKIHTLSEKQKDEMKRRTAKIYETLIKASGGETKKFYELIQKGKKDFDSKNSAKKK